MTGFHAHADQQKRLSDGKNDPAGTIQMVDASMRICRLRMLMVYNGSVLMIAAFGILTRVLKVLLTRSLEKDNGPAVYELLWMISRLVPEVAGVEVSAAGMIARLIAEVSGVEVSAVGMPAVEDL